MTEVGFLGGGFYKDPALGISSFTTEEHGDFLVTAVKKERPCRLVSNGRSRCQSKGSVWQRTHDQFLALSIRARARGGTQYWDSYLPCAKPWI